MQRENAIFFSGNEAFLENLESQGNTPLPKIWKELLSKRTDVSPQPSWVGSQNFSPPPKGHQGACNTQEKEVVFLRQQGYLFAHTNPLSAPSPLPKRYAHLHNHSLASAYLKAIALEVGHIASNKERHFLHQLFESSAPPLPPTQRKTIYTHLLRAHLFEQTLGRSYPGTKRFNLEGAEALLPALHMLVEAAANNKISTIMLGMAHRGRLTLLYHLLNKPLNLIAAGFRQDTCPVGPSDVPYHLGWMCPSKEKMPCITLLPNPSHLESINPVLMGAVHALRKKPRENPLGVLIHGDAAFAGQGLVMESLMLSGLPSYNTGGIIHIVIDNQIGFTASPYETCARLSTDIAHGVGAPVFHVNGGDPEAVILAFQRAFLYRETFKKDCILRLLCFRRHGHNELDEPRFTNPLLYQTIDTLPPLATRYGEHLVQSALLTKEERETFTKTITSDLRNALSTPLKSPLIKGPIYPERSKPIPVTRGQLVRIGRALTHVPDMFSLHAKVKKTLEKRDAQIASKQPLDWAMGEALALGTLLDQGIAVRFSGQDSARGTFTQRHGALIDQESGKPYVSLQHVSEHQAHFQLINTPLSEAGALGFELGYSWSQPQDLVIWEAQFGDFVNGAQVQIDQYLASAEQKWGYKTSLVLLLPHGYEGQGAEHSSARLERFLQLAAADNMRVVNCTTPAQFFHVLRRQAYTSLKPLVVMTPKSLLRHPEATSSLEDLEHPAAFQPVLAPQSKKPAKRIIVCSGKIYYDLHAQIKEHTDCTLIRLEELAPFPETALKKVLNDLQKRPSDLLWVQEEPLNMGAWTHVRPYLEAIAHGLGLPVPRVVARPASATTATGFFSCHSEEQGAIIAQALSHT